MAIESAGILLYRGSPREVFLIHMGGPLWANKDEMAWSIPKGRIDANEDPLSAAQRELFEETGFIAKPPFTPLGRFHQNSRKNLTVWAAAGDCDPKALVSNTFLMEWPPDSGVLLEYPEADCGAWLTQSAAWRKIVRGQRPILKHFFSIAGVER
jgi:predicted NUDIX family NTP pyrophosphohydrolase